MPSYEFDRLRARLHPDKVAFSLIPVDHGNVDLSVPIFRLRDDEYGRTMAGAICAAIQTVNQEFNVRHMMPDGITERWTGPGCV